VSGEANCVKTLVAPASAKEKDQHDNQENQHDATSWDTGLTDCPRAAGGRCVEQDRSENYLSGGRLAAIFTTCVWSSVSQASTPIASASERASLTAASCVGEMACGALGMTLISCSRTAVACETRTSPGFTFDNDSGGFSFDTTSVWADLAIRAVPFST
jgi:hypothetical protein